MKLKIKDRVLLELNNDSTISLAEIGRRNHNRRTVICRVARKLEKEGYIRKVGYEITKQGKHYIKLNNLTRLS